MITQGLSFLICNVGLSLPSSQDWWGSNAVMCRHQPPSLTYQTLDYVRVLPPCPKPLLAQLLSRLRLGKMRKKKSWTQTWPTFSAKSLVFQEEKRGSSNGALSQLARTWPDVLFQKLPAKEGPQGPFFQSYVAWALWPPELWKLLSKHQFLACYIRVLV